MPETTKSNAPTKQSSIDVFSILRDILKDWWLILVAGLIAAMGSYIVASERYEPVYTTGTTFVVSAKGTASSVYANLSTAQSMAELFDKILNSDVLKTKINEDIGTETLPGTIESQVIPETNLLVLTVKAPTPKLSFDIIQSVMNNYTSVSDYMTGNAILQVLEAPTLPMAPSNPLNTKDISQKAFLIGAAAMIVLLAVLSYLRDNVKNEKEVSKKLDTRLFGTVYHENKYKSIEARLHHKKMSVLITNPTVSMSFVETFKKLRTKLEYQANKHQMKVVMVTSVQENEGKSTVATNLALSLAQKFDNVLLVDADLRKPALYKVLEQKVEKENEIGHSIQSEEEVTLLREEKTGLYLILGSKHCPNSTELVSGTYFKTLIEELSEYMDYIIIDTPPISLMADAEAIAECADASLLVVRQSMSLTKDINDAIDVLNRSDAKLLGCVFNDVHTALTPLHSYGYGYGYGYGYRYGRHYGHYANPYGEERSRTNPTSSTEEEAHDTGHA